MSMQFDEILDEDGFHGEDIHTVATWVESQLKEIISSPAYLLKAVNFSTYGASFVHINAEGKPVAPLYNYLKPFPETLKTQFYQNYGGENAFAVSTASPVLGNLNSGLQLYRLKYQLPDIFSKIRYSLHLPQYMSYLVTGRAYSDITSIGCHTGLWNFTENRYHEWIYRESIAEKLAPIFPSDQGMPTQKNGQAFIAGVGLHDSSAALIPYLASFTSSFLLISTGTWCISLNPFNQTRLTAEELKNDCLCYMEYHGKPIKASRLFSGFEHERQVKLIAEHFNVAENFYKDMQPDAALLSRLQSSAEPLEVKAGYEEYAVAGRRPLNHFSNYKEAYHLFMMDLVTLQVASTNLVIYNSPVEKIYVDGGFGKNAIWMHLLAAAYPDVEVYAASVAQASAIGAALAIHTSWNKNHVPADIIELKRFKNVNTVNI